MISDLKQVKPSLVEEAVNKKIVQDVIGVKKLGLGVNKITQKQKVEMLRSITCTDKL